MPDPGYCEMCFHEDGKRRVFDHDVWDWAGNTFHEHGWFCTDCYWQVEYYSTETMTREDYEHDRKMIESYEQEKARERNASRDPRG